ncbi:family 43 glycosylhydrolase [Actinoplanes oblitus]|uniref:Family 43 glycosylhydrolase n=1 Tax=Actinoplanes oblitus TaxID=3040509 RepID=A0ABY8WPV1_9ACTN|nr:glycoside hydrolase family 43 protein [Actinoplanes oblitus]WIM98900.1 family 43 glycosylhydrolase [Actinoplanes oblitus]
MSFDPIIAGFHPDPTVCRVGDDYYLATSSFEYVPGVPLFHSRDLTSWRRIGHILTRPEQLDPDELTPSRGIFAPTLRYHDGRFWMVTTNTSRMMSGQLIVHATNPAGPWSDPVYVPGALGIDPDLAWDEAGDCYLTYASYGMRAPAGITQVRISPATGAELSEHYPVWQGTGLAHPEGPHLYLIDGTWYLMLAEGGTERGHAVTIARGPGPAGPFTACPANPILSHRSTGHPVQNTGHADLVQAADGGWWAVHLGVRPRGTTPHFHVLGRETFLARVDWADGWPALTTVSRPGGPADHSFGVTDGVFDSRWVAPGADPAAIAAPHPEGGALLRSADLLCVRVTDRSWTATATFAGPGRLVLRLDHRHWYALHVSDGVATAIARIGDLEQVVGTAPAGPLRISAVAPAGDDSASASGPDDIVLSAAGTELARLDGRYLSTEVAGGFTGRMLGIGTLGTSETRLVSFTYRGEG